MTPVEYNRLLEFHDQVTDAYNPTGVYQAHKVGDLWGIGLRSRTTIKNLASVIQGMKMTSCIALADSKGQIGYVKDVYIMKNGSNELDPIRIDCLDDEGEIVQTPINPRYVWGYFRHPQAALFIVDHGHHPFIHQILLTGSDIHSDLGTRRALAKQCSGLIVPRQKHS